MKYIINLKNKHSFYIKTTIFIALKLILTLIILVFTSKAQSQIIMVSDTVEAGEIVQFSHNLININSQIWHFGDGDSSIIASPSHSYNSTLCGFSTKIIELETTNNLNITSTITKNVVIKNIAPLPTLADIDLFTPFSNCNNSPSLSNPNFSISLQNTTNDTNLVAFYLIDWGDNTLIDTILNQMFPINHTYHSLGLFQFKITAVNQFGCSSTNQYQIANQSNPALGLSSLGSTQGCAPQEFTFILSQYQSNSPGTYYIWNFGDGSPNITWNYNDPYINDSIKHIFQSTSCQNGGLSFTVSVTAYNYCDQTTATVSNIRIYTSPTAQFTSTADTSCLGSPINFTNNTLSGFGYNCNGNANYLWDYGDGSSSNLTNGQHTYSNSGTFTVKLIASNGVCGSSMDSTVLIINDEPLASATLTTLQACDSVMPMISNQSMGGNLKYKWTISPSTGWQLTNGTSLSSENPQFKFNNKGVYILNLKAYNNCGSDDTSFQIRVMAKPTVKINTISNFCGTATFNPSAIIDSNYNFITNVSWNFGLGQPMGSNLMNPGSVFYLNSGTQLITLSTTNICGTSQDSITFIIHNQPIVQAYSPNPVICLGDSVQLIGSGALNYQWKLGANLVSTNTNPKISPNLSSTYFLFGQDSNLCTNSDTISVTVNNLPNINIGTNSTIICIGDTLMLSGFGGTNYEWKTNGITISQSSTISYAPTQAGQIILSGNDVNNCNSSDTMSYQIFTPPTVNISQNNPSICMGDSIQIQIGGATTIITSPNISPNGNNYVFAPNASTIYQISAYDLLGCKTDTTITINVIALPQIITNQSDTSICTNDSIHINAQGGINYQWISNATVISNQSNISFAPTNTGNIILKGWDSYGCSNTDTAHFQVIALPNIQLSSSNTNICKGDSFNLMVSTANNYEWRKNGQYFSSTQIITDTLLKSALFQVIAIANSGCKSKDTVLVNVSNLPTIISLASSNYICIGDSLPINLSGGVNYKINGSISNSITYLKPTFSTSYLIEGQDANGCYDSTYFNLTVNTLPLVNATSNQSAICLGQSTQLSASGASNYLWTPASGISNPNSVNTSVTPTTTTIYTVIGTDLHGCKNRDSVLVQVSNSFNIQATASKQSICVGDSIQLFATGANSFHWAGGNGLLSNSNDTVLASPNFSTSYIVTGTDTMGCIATNSITVIVKPLPIINLTTSKNSICPGDSVNLLASGASNYNWIIDDSTQNTSASGATITFYPTSNTVFTVVATDSNQCKATQSASIFVLEKPNVLASTDKTTICEGDFVLLSATGGQSYHWDPVGNIAQPNSATSTGAPTQNQWYKVVGQSSNGCFDDDSVFVSVLQKPTLTATNPIIEICMGDSANLQLIGSGQITWLPNLGLSSNMGNNIKASPLSSTNYTGQITDSNGCINHTFIQLNVNALPIASFISDTITCKNNTINYINQSTNTINFNWNFGDSTSSNLQNPTHNFNQTGFYETRLIAISSSNCTDTIKNVIHVIDVPQANFTTFPKSGCSPITLNLNNSSQTYGGQYFWSFGDGQTSTISNPTNISLSSQAGHDTILGIKLTTSNLCGTSSAYDTISILTKPISNFGFNLSSQCSPTTASFGNVSSTNATSYQWDLGDTTNCFQNTPSPKIYTTGNLPTDFQIKLISINSCGSDTMTKILHLNPNYVHAVFTPSTIQACAPATIQFANYSNIQTIAGWNFGDGNVSSQINPTHTYLNSGIYHVSLVVTDNCGIDTTTTTIIVGSPPQINFSINSDTICQFANVIMNNLTPNLTNLQWNFGDSSTSNMTNINHKYNQSGQFIIKLIGEDLTSHCSDTAQKIIQINPSATANIEVSDPDGCYPITINFQNTSSGSNYFEWDFADGNTAIVNAPSHVFSTPGIFNVQLVANNFWGCSDTTYTIIKAYPRPLASYNFTNKTPCQLPAYIEFTNTSTGALGYFWDFDNKDSSENKNPIAEYQLAGNYTPKLIAYNTFNCTDTFTSSIVLMPLPIANFDVDIQSGCENLGVQFQNKSQNAQYYQWNFDNNSTTNHENPYNIYLNAGNYNPYLIATNTQGCIDTFNLKDTIKIFPNPQVNFQWQNIDSEQKEKGNFLFENLTLNADSFSWTFGDGGQSSKINPTHQYYDDGEFIINLNAYNSFGCSDILTKKLVVNMLKGLYIPTALAPNHPNPEVREFTPVGKGLLTYHIAVYDAWGTLLWETTQLLDGEPVESWNGTSAEGNPIKQGVYFWIAEATFIDQTIWRGMTLPDGQVVTKGSLTLIR